MLRVRKRELAEDLVQETLLAALRAKERFQGRSGERSWLVGILKNKIADYFRKLGWEQSFTDMAFYADESGDKFEDNYWIHELGPKDWRPESDEVRHRTEFWKVLRACLSKMPPRVADVFLLREVEDQDTEEICESLSISAANLWVMLHRARMALRGCLEDNWFEKNNKRTSP